ncbi:hypothetical protein PC116_g14560 [Phytophthora cactorum]|uniref:Uncharacterized protein n=1 Tax=Phytophthora cactorum TaxID=29920 RepID=A0A8T1DSZ4_9STRA|nr:hypothetical protein PC117_g9185 [Phytophthora cactorum]KAG2998042.1 hypothetical protein PC119_g17539 [Phytophthora cactorum]KAG3018954.1 hypothetical protein PC120_g10156 [Phytophthora cactorum]KAG3166551.1 hypothetical protein C6341_g12026 [Phytophthora cactorum]KAG4237380.1 hypothetical protein PC116_g14560 [Phytophthora cactorum]
MVRRDAESSPSLTIAFSVVGSVVVPFVACYACTRAARN